MRKGIDMTMLTFSLAERHMGHRIARQICWSFLKRVARFFQASRDIAVQQITDRYAGERWSDAIERDLNEALTGNPHRRG
jgi:hypothetical protein